jgi:tetratricopeptide (TPR) repeat protein
MSVKFGLAMIAAGAVAALSAPAFAAMPRIAETASHQTFGGTENMAVVCAAAATAAETNGTATEGGLRACTTAINLAGDGKARLAAALTNRGVLHLARAEYDAAIADSTAALDVDANMAEAMVNRGVALMLSGQPKDAVTDLTRALALAPAHEERAYFNRAMAREDSGDQLGAYLDYRKASELAPNWDRPKHELARFTVVRRGPIS